MKVLAHAARWFLRLPPIRRRLVSALLVLTIATAGVTSNPRDAWAPTAVEYAVMLSLVIVVALAAVSIAGPEIVANNAPTGSAMSCPVFGGSGMLLGEDSCVWAKAAGQWTSQSGNNSSTALLRMGGQKEIAPDWFLGGAFGAGSKWSQDGSGGNGTGQVYDGSIALKHTMGPWLIAGALAFSSTSMHLSPAASSLSGDVNVYTAAMRLRGAYDFAFDGWYLRPRLDLDLTQTTRPGFTLSGANFAGTGQAGLAVDGYSQTSFAATPMLELGGRIDFDAKGDNPMVLRPYVAAGASFQPNNTSTMTANFIGPLAAVGSFQSTTTSPSVLGNVEAGLQLYNKRGFELKAEYTLSAGDSYLSQGASLRGAYHF